MNYCGHVDVPVSCYVGRRISIRCALDGGVTATVFWEIIRYILIWYYSTLSLVNVIHGFLPPAVVALLSLEIAVIVLFLGAQVIAEFESGTSEIPNVDQLGFYI